MKNKLVKNKLEISIVITSYNRSEMIPVILKALADQTLPPSAFEVILVDDGSPDSTPETVASLMADQPFELRYLRHENKGIGFSQNRGIQAARAPIVMLMPDDIILQPGALKAHLKEHKIRFNRSTVVLGRVLQSPELAKESVFLQKWDPFKFKHLKNKHELPYYFFWACNVSFKKEFVVRHGLFNEALTPGGADAHEDVELGCRLADHGMRIFYNKEAAGDHYHVMEFEAVAKKYYDKGQKWPRFYHLVNRPEIAVRYHVLCRNTFNDYRTALGDVRHLFKEDHHPVFLFARHAAHAFVFNGITVPFIWLPLVRKVEKKRLPVKMLNGTVYRGILFHFFFKGAVDKFKGISKAKLYNLQMV